MVFLLQVEGAEKTLALAGKWIPRWVAEGSFYRPRPTDRATRSYTVLGWINTVGCAAALRIRAAWGMSLTTSAGHGRRLYALSVGVKGRINDSPCEGAVGREPGEISER